MADNNQLSVGDSYEFDIVATDVDWDDHEFLPVLALLGPYDTRHEAIGMAVLAARFADREWDDYKVRAHQTMSDRETAITQP